MDWKDLTYCLLRASKSNADGIVVLHGTDTIEYTISAVCAFNSSWNKKICFTGHSFLLIIQVRTLKRI